MTNPFDQIKKLALEDTSVEKHILLLKLTEALENAPEFGSSPKLDTDTFQRQWLSKVKY